MFSKINKLISKIISYIEKKSINMCGRGQGDKDLCFYLEGSVQKYTHTRIYIHKHITQLRPQLIWWNHFREEHLYYTRLLPKMAQSTQKFTSEFSYMNDRPLMGQQHAGCHLLLFLKVISYSNKDKRFMHKLLKCHHAVIIHHITVK